MDFKLILAGNRESRKAFIESLTHNSAVKLRLDPDASYNVQSEPGALIYDFNFKQHRIVIVNLDSSIRPSQNDQYFCKSAKGLILADAPGELKQKLEKICDKVAAEMGYVVAKYNVSTNSDALECVEGIVGNYLQNLLNAPVTQEDVVEVDDKQLLTSQTYTGNLNELFARRREDLRAKQQEDDNRVLPSQLDFRR